jgi:plasmid stabilization system protein ParE
MPKLIYTPKAIDDLQGIKIYVSRQFGADRAKICVREIATTVRQLEMFPDEGSGG